MKLPLYIKHALFIGLFAAVFMLPSMSEAANVKVQTESIVGNASAGESGANIASSAMISVVVTNDRRGNPVSNLGASVGNGTSAVTLPAGWNLTTIVVPPGGCLMTPTQFNNHRNGIYTIRVVPFVTNPNCRWLAGEYNYAVRVNVPVGNKTFKGSGLGKLIIQ